MLDVNTRFDIKLMACEAVYSEAMKLADTETKKNFLMRCHQKRVEAIEKERSEALKSLRA